jgi:hypothetical protein
VGIVIAQADMTTKKYSTLTVRSDGVIVPWLAAEGPLAYSPENPPETNYRFQYSWLMPRVYSDSRHYYFGKWSSLSRQYGHSDVQLLVDFWDKARANTIEPICVSPGERTANGFTAPIACYRFLRDWNNRDTYFFMQHGSYLLIDVAEQPLLKDGMLVLYRGLGKKRRFCWRSYDNNLSPQQNSILQRYFDVHFKAFSDSEISFQIAHVWVRRAETGFLKWEMSWIDLAQQTGFNPESEHLSRRLTDAYRQSFTLIKRTAAWKFGPNYVRCLTPLNNVRITSFFAGESEVNVIDPRKIEITTPCLGKSMYGTINLKDEVWP